MLYSRAVKAALESHPGSRFFTYPVRGRGVGKRASRQGSQFSEDKPPIPLASVPVPQDY